MHSCWQGSTDLFKDYKLVVVVESSGGNVLERTGLVRIDVGLDGLDDCGWISHVSRFRVRLTLLSFVRATLDDSKGGSLRDQRAARSVGATHNVERHGGWGIGNGTVARFVLILTSGGPGPWRAR